jgi:hypothetical protein
MWIFNTRHDFGVETDPTQGEFFVNNEIDRSGALVREAIQNSLDARREGVDKVEVHFTIREGSLFLGATVMDEYLQGLTPHLAACGLDLKELDLDNPRFLVIEDFGTHGLRGNPDTEEPSDFYYFWHVVGRSGRTDAKGGRWGLGKTVFANSAQISAFFGYTIRSDDRRHLLFGQTALKTHEMDGQTFLPHAFFQSSGQRLFELPFDAKDHAKKLQQFRADFHLIRAKDRAEESGLSVVVPFPYAEITEPGLVEAAIAHYFFPILAGDLVVHVNDQIIDKTKILKLAAGLQTSKLKDIEKTLKFAAEIQQLSPPALREVDFPRRLNTESGRVPSEAFAPDHLAQLRREFREEKLLAVRLPVLIEPKGAPDQLSFVTIYLKRDQMLLRGHDFYIRSGVTLSGQSVFSGRPALGLLLAEDVPVCRFLGDAENPAHTLWNPRSPRLAAKYRRAQDTVRFIREAMSSLLDTLSQVAEEEDRGALADYFSLPKKGDKQPRLKDEAGRSPTPAPPLVLPPQKFTLSPVKGGFRLRGGPDLKIEDLPLRLAVLTAYEIRRGNPFKKYNPNDYRLDATPIEIEATGVDGLNRSAQRLEFTIASPDFTVAVSGFDVHRDLKLRVDEISDTE